MLALTWLFLDSLLLLLVSNLNYQHTTPVAGRKLLSLSFLSLSPMLSGITSAKVKSSDMSSSILRNQATVLQLRHHMFNYLAPKLLTVYPFFVLLATTSWRPNFPT